MKNKDTILKYLSDLMDDAERIEFENRLKTDSKLKEEFEKVKSNLTNISEAAEVVNGSNYFNNLVPKVREKIEVKQRKNRFAFIPAISMAVTASIVFLITFPSSSEHDFFNFNITSEDLSTVVSESDSIDVDNLLGTNFLDDYAYYNSSEITEEYDSYLEESVLADVDLESISDFYDDSQINNYSNYSDEQVDAIYEELINKKIL